MSRVAIRVVRLDRIRSESARVHLLDQPSQHPPDFEETCIQRGMLLVGEESKVAGEEKEVFQLTRGSRRNMEELAEFRPAGSGASFRDISRHRRCRSPHLAGDSISFVFRKRRSRGINTQGQRMAIAPDLELLIVLHTVSLTYTFIYIYLQLRTNNCQQLRGAKC
jgi:hypothetical protein